MILKEDIIKVAGLSRLSLTEVEIENYQKEFTRILDFFEVLSEVNTDGVEPTAQITGLKNVLRFDDINNFDSEKLIECSHQVKVKKQVAVAPVM
ncbi:TPA: Asp-tRNA(Asn)/Glu-tRNA(Gln) amidotransferase subunit GatC [Candidatus Peregrinibacteria bacterium]|nr:Asp-tRNA(Asn)/Glu-tRNA(Gln) amidotransferase subunit GatC [Candidatus Peregrinibacteria bacterium]HIQ57690.1 Asp-tRNA(Asn)/Glu-tRNA(Gln) amidotransferase subunit GatC [Candidatus Gracilibacteria bacterium]